MKLAPSQRMGAWLCGCIVAMALTAVPTHAFESPVSGTIDLGQASPGASLGSVAGDNAASVAFLGDVNDDSFQDVAIGAPGASPENRRGAGAVYVVFGPFGDKPVDVSNLGDRGYRLAGQVRGARAGRAIAALGDYDGDGYDDFAIGAPGARDPRCAGCAVNVFLVRGSARKTDVDLDEDESVVSIYGDAGDDSAGFALARLGSGLIIGAPLADPAGRSNAGKVYVLLPGRLPRRAALDLSSMDTVGYRIDGPAAGEQMGYSVGSVDDLSGDGAPEVVAGAPFSGPDLRSGAAHVITSRPAGSNVDLAVPDGTGLQFTGLPGERLGSSVAGMDDLNGDGRPDIAIGAPGAAPNGRRNAGRVHVAFGRAPAPLPILLTGDVASGYRIDGGSTGDAFGNSIAPVRGLDSDAIPDLLVGAPLADALGRRSAGATYALRGAAIRIGVDTALLGRAGVRIAGQTMGWQSGHSLAARTTATPDRPRLLIGNARQACDGCPAASAVTIIDAPTVEPPPQRIDPQTTSGCKEIRDVEVIVDSSGSMKTADPQRLRRAAIELLLTKPRAKEIKIGVLALRSAPTQVFPTLSVGTGGFTDGPDLQVLRGLLDEHIGNDFGISNYLAGLMAARRQSPGAGALILITDADDAFPPAPVIDQPSPRVYVLRLARGTRAPRAEQGLRDIVARTGGKYIEILDGDALPAALGLVDAELHCEEPLRARVSDGAQSPSSGSAPPGFQNELASTTLTDANVDSGFVATLPPRPTSTTLSVSWNQPKQKRTRRTSARRCLDSSIVALAGVRVLRGSREIARISERKLRSALGGRSAKVGALRAVGRCARGVMTLRITGYERLPTTGAQAAGGSRSRISTRVRRNPRRRRGGPRGRATRTAFAAAAKTRGR